MEPKSRLGSPTLSSTTERIMRSVRPSVPPFTRHIGPALCITQRCSLGSAVSPVLATLFMHYAFDLFLVRVFPTVQFERYCDDAVVHCVTERQARQVWAALAERMESVGLRLHPDKTRIVYCKDSKRRKPFEHVSFRFLGYT